MMKKVISVFIAVCVLCGVMPFCTATAESAAYETKFYVPETIYLNPASTTTGQYFYGLTDTGAVDSANDAPSNHTAALLYWEMEGATNIRITAKVSSNQWSANGSNGSISEITDVSTTNISSISIASAASATATVNTAISSTGISASSSKISCYVKGITVPQTTSGFYRFIEWTATYISPEGVECRQVAYTAVYSPNRSVTALGVTGFDYNSSESFASGLMYIQGAQISNEASYIALDSAVDHRSNYQNVSSDKILDPLVNGVSQPSNNPPQAWGTTAAPTFDNATRSFASCNCVREREVDGNGDWVCHVDCNRTPAEVVADTSRFSNVNQLPTTPRLRFMVTDWDNTEQRRNWYVSDATAEVTGGNTSNPMLMNGQSVDLLKHSYWKSDIQSTAAYSEKAGTVLASNGNGASPGGDCGSSAVGEKYNTPISYTLSGGSTTRYYRFGVTGSKNKSYAMSTGTLLLKIHAVNKSSLRSACVSFTGAAQPTSNWYSTTISQTYRKVLAQNYMRLGVPSCTNVKWVSPQTYMTDFSSAAITFYAPETIYLDPASANSSTYHFKYFADCDAQGNLRTNATQTSGIVHFSIELPCKNVTMQWSGATPSYTTSGSGSTYTWTITGGSTTIRRGAATVTIRYTLMNDVSYTVSRRVYLYMPRMNATVGVGGGYQYKTTIGNEPVTAATVLLGGLHKVGGGYHSNWTAASTGDNTSPLIAMPSTQSAGDNGGSWPDGSAYNAMFFNTDSGYNRDEGDGFTATLASTSANGGGAKWCGSERDGSTTKTWSSGVAGQITIDKSRHSTLATVPFLQGGWMIHYNSNSGENADAQFSSTNGDLRVGPSDAINFRGDEGVSYPTYGSTPYHMTGTVPSNDTTYTMRGNFYFRRSSSSGVHMYLDFTLSLKIVDKSALRDLTNEALKKGYRTDFFDGNEWASRVNALNNAILSSCVVLGNPEATAQEISTSNSTLSTAMQNCKVFADDQAHSHDWICTATITAPTCTQTGTANFVCSVCGTKTVQTVDALGHDFDDSIPENVTIVPSTTTVPGSKTVKCSRCSETQTTPLPLQSAQLIVNAGKAYPGNTVDVTVDVQDNPGITAALLQISYDPNVLTLVSATNGGLISGGTFTTGDNYAAIPFSVIIEDSLAQSNYTEDGTLVVFTFRVKEDAALGTTPITVTYDAQSTFDKDLNEVSFDVQNGSLLVAERVSGDAGGDGSLDLRDVTLLVRYLAGWEGIEIDPICADVNGDGLVNLKDSALIRRYLAGWDVVLQ